jgi:hypothetical protein
MFSDHDFEYYKPNYATHFPGGVAPNPAKGYDSGVNDGDFMSSGDGDDTIVSVGLDNVNGGFGNNYFIVDGAYLDVYNWLRGRFVTPTPATIDAVLVQAANLPWVKPFPACPI